MAKSKRSKVKMAYKAIRRSVLESKERAALAEKAARIYSSIGLELPAGTGKCEETMPARSHGGSVVVTTFTPTPARPALNIVHGPLACDDSMLTIPAPPLRPPIQGAATRARLEAETTVRPARMEQDTVVANYEERPYFYPRRAKGKKGEKLMKGGIRKVNAPKRPTRHPKNKQGTRFI